MVVSEADKVWTQFWVKVSNHMLSLAIWAYLTMLLISPCPNVLILSPISETMSSCFSLGSTLRIFQSYNLFFAWLKSIIIFNLDCKLSLLTASKPQTGILLVLNLFWTHCTQVWREILYNLRLMKHVDFEKICLSWKISKIHYNFWNWKFI